MFWSQLSQDLHCLQALQMLKHQKLRQHNTSLQIKNTIVVQERQFKIL